LCARASLFTAIEYKLSLAAIEHGAVAALLLGHSSELVLPENLCVSDLNTLKDTSAKSPVNVTLTCRVTVPADHPKPSPALIKAGGAGRHDGQLQQHIHTIAAYAPPTMPLSTLVLLVHTQAAAVADKLQSARHELLQVCVVKSFFYTALVLFVPPFHCDAVSRSSTCRAGRTASTSACRTHPRTAP
jgi:hypothetical protein